MRDYLLICISITVIIHIGLCWTWGEVHTRQAALCLPHASNERGEHLRAQNEHYFCWFGIHSAIHFSGRKFKWSTPSTRRALKAISPQSSGWNPLQLNNFLHLVSIPRWHPCSIITLLSWHQSQPLSGSLLFPEWWWKGNDHSSVWGYNLEIKEKHGTENHSLCL